VQTSPAIRLPSDPNSVARNSIFKASAMKQQTGDANNMAKKSGQFTRTGFVEGLIGGFSCDNSFPQAGQHAAG
jgi:hypothetical protein